MIDAAAWMTVERARLDAAGRTRACPVCGIEVWYTCHHDGEDVRAVEMSKAAARELYDFEHEPDVAEVAEQRLAQTPGSLGDLYRRVLLELGVLAQPPGTVHREARFAIDDAPPTMNTNELRSHWKDAHAVKSKWQGRYAQALDALDLDRPIRSVDGAGDLAPVFAHVVVTTPGGKRADSPNYWIAVKSLGDALTGKRGGQDADRAINYNHRTYIAGWLDEDNDRHLLTWLEVRGGQRHTAVTLSWDEPAAPRS